MRVFLGVLAGAVVAVVTIMLVELIGFKLFPPTQQLRADELVRLVEITPLGGRVMVVLSWLLGALAGGAVARRIAGGVLATWIVALLVVGAGIANFLSIPHPLWMQVATVAAPLLGGWLATRTRLPHDHAVPAYAED